MFFFLSAINIAGVIRYTAQWSHIFEGQTKSMDSKGKSAQKVMFGKLSSETATMAPVGSKTSRPLSVCETVPVGPPMMWHTHVSGARFRNFHGGLKREELVSVHWWSVCVLPEASIHYLRPHKCKSTGLLYPWERRKNREYGFFPSVFSPWSSRLATWKLKIHIHWHTYTLTAAQTQTNGYFKVKFPLSMILLLVPFSAIKCLSHHMGDKSRTLISLYLFLVMINN